MNQRSNCFYQILKVILPYLRNCLNSERKGLFKHDDAAVEAELIHNCYTLIFNENYSNQDLYFINFQIKQYLKRLDQSANKNVILPALEFLIESCPAEIKKKIDVDVLSFFQTWKKGRINS